MQRASRSPATSHPHPGASWVERRQPSWGDGRGGRTRGTHYRAEQKRSSSLGSLPRHRPQPREQCQRTQRILGSIQESFLAWSESHGQGIHMPPREEREAQAHTHTRMQTLSASHHVPFPETGGSRASRLSSLFASLSPRLSHCCQLLPDQKEVERQQDMARWQGRTR